MSFPSWSHVVGRSGTSFSGARAECPCSHEQPHTSVKRHQDRDAGAISEMLFVLFSESENTDERSERVEAAC